MKQTALRRGAGLSRAGRLRWRSAKTEAAAPARSAVLEAVRARAGGNCEACPILYRAGIERDRTGLPHPGRDGHEVLTRGRGGSITRADNVLFVCRWSHRLIGDQPALADRLGLTRPSWSASCTP